MTFSLVARWAALAALISAAGVACGGASANERRVRDAEDTVAKERTAEQLMARGRAFFQVGDYTRSIQYFNDAIRAGAPEREAAQPLMLAYVQSNQFRLGIAFGEDYLRRHPGDYRLRYLVGTLLNAIGKPKHAAAHFRRVVQSNADFADAHYALAVVYRDFDHRPTLADSHFRKYLSLQPQGEHADEAREGLLKSVQ